MARGVGALNVSVNANTAQAIKNIQDFRKETKSAAADAREAAKSFRGNTASDYEKRFGPKPEDVRQTAAEIKDFRSQVIDLTRDTRRYSDEAVKQAGVVRQLNGAMNQLKAVGKAFAVLMVAKEAFDFGQQLRGHIEYIHSWADAQREAAAMLGLTKSGLELEMEALEKRKEKQEAAIAKQDELIAKQKEAAEQLKQDYASDRNELRDKYEIATAGEEQAAYFRDQRKYGLLAAAELRKQRQEVMYYEDARQKAKEAKEEEARKKKEAEREKERKHEEAIRKAQENARRDAEAIQKLRDRVADFAKTDLQKDQSELLRTLESAEQRAEARRHFATLTRLQKDKDALKQLQEDRKNLAGRGGGDGILDARSAEGWAQLRSSTKDLQLKKMDEQIALQKEANRLATQKAKTEVYKF